MQSNVVKLDEEISETERYFSNILYKPGPAAVIDFTVRLGLFLPHTPH